MPSRILVVDDHPIVQMGIRMVLENSSRYSLCGEAADVQSARKLTEDLRPDIIILDLMMDGRDDIGFVKELCSLAPTSALLVFSALSEIQYAERAFRAGARGFVQKSAGLEAVLTALDQIAKGGWYASPSVQFSSFSHLIANRKSSTAPSLDNLSNREIDVFRMTGAGLSSPQIAAKLHLSRKTISTYRERIKIKLSLPSGRALDKHAEEFFLTGRVSLDTL